MGFLPRLLIAGLVATLSASCADDRPLIVVQPNGTTTEVQPCKRACNAPTADETHDLSEAEYREALEQMAGLPVGAGSLGIDTLLFYFAAVPGLMQSHGTDPLSAAHVAWLQEELDRQTVEIQLQLVADDGSILGALRQLIPLKTKQHLVLQGTGALGRVEIAGKTKRVGLGHLWSRF